MKKAIKYLIFVTTLLLLSGCCVPKVVIQRDTIKYVKTEYKEILKDTTIYVTLPSESVSVTTKDTTSTLKIKTAISTAEVNKGFLTHSLESNPHYKPEAEIKYRDIIRVKDSIVFVNNEVPVPVEKELTSWQKALISLGYVGIGAIALGLIWLIVKIRKKIILHK